MKPDISEFSYGYAVTEELVATAGGRVIGAPVFPSLYEEGQEGGGYDVEIPMVGRPIFLQFKLSDYLKKASAKEHRDGLIGLPYYRMHLRPYKHSDQHKLLLALEAKGESVFYIAPEFHLPNELNTHYLARTVINHSAAFRPSDIGALPDDDEHYLVFEKGKAFGLRCSSDPKEIRKTTLGNGIGSVLSEYKIEPRALGEKGIAELVEKMLELVRSRQFSGQEAALRAQELETVSQIVKSRSAVESAGYLARTFFGCELIVVR
jgi:hypothetical protein